ncbi:MAG: acyl carrier protein [Myxococcota bacterium]
MIRTTLTQVFAEVFEEHAGGEAPTLADASVLLETGLDSLGFAILVTRLEDELGYDPFTEAAEAVYPRTFGELVAFYERHAPAAA